MRTIHTRLTADPSPFGILVLSLLASGCEPSKLEGACEFSYPALGEYYCEHETSEADCTWGIENVYHPYDSCEDLGYGDYGDTWYTSPAGAYTPGAYGAFADGGVGTGDEGGSCVTAGYDCSSTACCSGSTCVDFSGSVTGQYCADYCTSGSECQSGCCAVTSDGSGVCAPYDYC
jgi:hypothetical protein